MDAAKADLMRALGRLVRGLSTLFWGIPLALAADVETARSGWMDSLGALGFAPAFVLSSLLWYGLRQMRDFQKQERVWHHALHRAELFAIVNTGLAPVPVLVAPVSLHPLLPGLRHPLGGVRLSFSYCRQSSPAPPGRHAPGRNAAPGDARLRRLEHVDAGRRAGRPLR